MKTYWLTGKRGRNSVTSHQSRRMSIVPDDLQAAVAATLAATNRGYSPVTMDDVARRSVSGSCRNSPIPPHVAVTGAQQPGRPFFTGPRFYRRARGKRMGERYARTLHRLTSGHLRPPGSRVVLDVCHSDFVECAIGGLRKQWVVSRVVFANAKL